jgi:gamma-glutamyltranspeptidase/glutathione hydrolase
MVVCPQPAAAEAGRDVLRAGGNAVDAAVTAALVQGVVDPRMCGIGGSGVMLVHLAGSGRQEVIEFHARAGRAVREDQWQALFVREAADRYGYVLEGRVNDCGYQSVGVPGTVAGLAEALHRHGTLSWADAIAPGLAAARRGLLVTAGIHRGWVADKGPDVVSGERRLTWTAESRRVFTRDGRLHGIGETIPTPDLAATYERLATAGPDDFYRGEIAAAIVADFRAGGGFIDAEDLAGYRPRVVSPLLGSYRGLDLAVPGPPAGGLSLLQMLNYLERFDLAHLGWPSAEAALRRVEAMAEAAAARSAHLGDPLFVHVPTSQLVAREYALATRSAHDSPSTTHVCVVDGEGGAVSLTHTLGSSSGVVTPGLGFNWNNYLNCFDPRPGRPNSLAPGKTRVTMMVPTIALRGGRLELVLGAPGGMRIASGVLQTLVNLVDHGLGPLEAVSAPRLDHQGDAVETELRMPSEVVTALERAGYTVRRRPLSYDHFFAEVQLIRVGEHGDCAGASDPRGDGGQPLPA